MFPLPRPASRVCAGQKMPSSLSQEWELNVPWLISNFPLHLPLRRHLPSGHLPSRGPAGSPGFGLRTGRDGMSQGLCFSPLGLGVLHVPPKMS